jgi:hypothetical protein
VGDQIIHLRLLAQEPEVQRVLSAPTRPVGNEAERLASAASSPLAVRMRAILQVRPALRLLQAFDGDGNLVASTVPRGRPSAADAPWFVALARAYPEANAYVGDIFRQSEGAPALFELAFPVYGEEGRWLGAVLAYVDADDLYSVISPVRIGRTGHADLIRASDGLVLASDESERVLKSPFPGFAQIQAGQRENRGYWVIPETRETLKSGEVVTEPARLVSWSTVDQLPNVRWLMVVEQDDAEAVAPITGVTRYLWIHFIGAFGTVILLALYFSFKLEKPTIEEELHLHEEHLPAGMKSSAD